ncbi:MAG: SDR family NAD(P)-dependent oxidoreductase [Geminicoccaceae bacterium]|nr:SDR family oxidoreductase [Geminicoccaceae bacterium]MDW8123661.1 SDR family NAD(P)-dependent oxidoreductase [Geminicoccaceae bacterium]
MEENRTMRFSGKSVIVTGGASGIGLACVEAFAAEGASVLVADIDRERGQAVAVRLGAEGRSVRFQPCDVSRREDCEAAVEAVLSWTGRLDVLINNAGILKRGDILELEEADFDAVLAVNLKGAFLMGRAAAKAMVEGGGGAIVNMSSVNGILAIPDQLAYVVSKGGLNQLTRAMALALADKGIRVNAIGPGSIATDLLRQVMTDEAARRRILSRTPMGRLGEPVEVARLALFLASAEASYITGQIIYIDGGRLPLNYTVPVPD